MIDKFRDWLQINDYSKGTIYNYIYNINIYILYIYNNNIYNIDFSNITNSNITSKEQLKKSIDDYILYMLKRNLAKETINNFIKAIRVYCKFINIDIPILKSLKPEEKLPEAITEEYFKKYIDEMIQFIFDNNALKVKTMLWFMFYTGLRKSEVYNLKRADFNLKERTVKVYQQKTKNERITFYTEEVKKLLEFYFSTEAEEEGAFNLGKGGIEYIFLVMKPYFKDVKLNPHIFRSSYATMLLKKGVDVTIVQKLLGHKNINSTLKYLKTNNELLKEIYDKKIK